MPEFVIDRSQSLLAVKDPPESSLNQLLPCLILPNGRDTVILAVV